jgi:protein-L-isoaspartate(D-aspartate) O-methyltransferase
MCRGRAFLRRSFRNSRVDGPLKMKPMTEQHLGILRRHMVELIAIYADLMGEEIGKAAFDQRVLAAMQRIPRHRFVPSELAALAYQDSPLPIGFDKTISQPFICALMLDLLDPRPEDVVLEVGTGLGYLAAVLADLSAEIWSVEIVEEFGSEAEQRLRQLGCHNVGVRIGDGSRGWSDHAPFDKIVVSAAASEVPQALIDQLRPGGRMVLPLGSDETQQMTVIDKSIDDELVARQIIPVRFSRLETGG